jgi:predicted AlkP superfamily phosphohydrolase/phosphomutase
MLHRELDRLDRGLLFCLFDTPDRLQHMFWRVREPDPPANVGRPVAEWAGVIEAHYRECDAVVGRALARADERTLVVVLSDHGFTSFQRGVHLNTWLHDHGFLALAPGVAPGDDAGDLLRHVDWGRTKAYALGLGSIYLNRRGREAQGVVGAADAAAVGRQIADGLTGLRDGVRGRTAVAGVSAREDVYAGPYTAEAPDLVVRFAPGYRVSWGTALGAVPGGHFEDNDRRWGGDHIVDPARVPGVLFMNRPFDGADARLLDLAPTILAALGVPKGPAMEGRSLLPAA